MKKLYIALEDGEVNYVYFDEPIEVVIIDHDESRAGDIRLTSATVWKTTQLRYEDEQLLNGFNPYMEEDEEGEQNAAYNLPL